MKRGKKKKLSLIIAIGITILIIAGGVAGYLISKSINKSNLQFRESISEVIQPEIDKYCQDLESNSGYCHCEGGLLCPTCRESGYVYVNNIDEIPPGKYFWDKYTIKKQGDIYKITMELTTDYSRGIYRAGYEGSSLLFFDIDKNFQIISKNLTSPVCH